MGQWATCIVSVSGLQTSVGIMLVSSRLFRWNLLDTAIHLWAIRQPDRPL